MTPETSRQPERRRDPSTCVIGAGLCGLTVAHRLREAGHPVTVIDKGRGPGGRLSTRHEGALQFDHGAQYFTVSDERFRSHVEAWLERGIATIWDVTPVVLDQGRVSTSRGEMVRYVGVPGMSAVAADLARGLDVGFETKVTAVERSAEGWTIRSAAGVLGRFDRVILTVPAPQALPLLVDAPGLHAAVEPVRMVATWAAMMRFPQPLDVSFDAAFVKNSPVTWAARNGSKSGRPDPNTWVVHGAPDWSKEHADDPPIRVAAALTDAFFDAAGAAPQEPSHLVPHRWRYAFPENDVGEFFLWDAQLGIGVAGDWCLPGARVEGAFLSGYEMASALLV